MSQNLSYLELLPTLTTFYTDLSGIFVPFQFCVPYIRYLAYLKAKVARIFKWKLYDACCSHEPRYDACMFNCIKKSSYTCITTRLLNSFNPERAMHVCWFIVKKLAAQNSAFYYQIKRFQYRKHMKVQYIWQVELMIRN